MWWRSSFWQIILNTLVLVLYSIDIQDAIEGAGWYFKVQNETRLKASGLRLPEHDGDYTKENFKIQIQNFRIQCITGGAFRRLPQLSSLALQHNDIAGEKFVLKPSHVFPQVWSEQFSQAWPRSPQFSWRETPCIATVDSNGSQCGFHPRYLYLELCLLSE